MGATEVIRDLGPTPCKQFECEHIETCKRGFCCGVFRAWAEGRSTRGRSRIPSRKIFEKLFPGYEVPAEARKPEEAT